MSRILQHSRIIFLLFWDQFGWNFFYELART